MKTKPITRSTAKPYDPEFTLLEMYLLAALVLIGLVTIINYQIIRHEVIYAHLDQMNKEFHGLETERREYKYHTGE